MVNDEMAELIDILNPGIFTEDRTTTSRLREMADPEWGGGEW